MVTLLMAVMMVIMMVVVGHNDGDDNDDKLLLNVCSGNRLILFHMTNTLPCARSDLAALPYENTMTFNILFNYTF
jgi:hypothetical protein